MLDDLRFRLRAVFRRDAMERELDEELRFHVEREAEKYERAGMTREDAYRRARLAFGGVERIKDDARDARGISLIENARQDLRYALRSLRVNPGFTAAVVITLALGIGANTAMFGILDRLLFRAPAFLREPDRVHRVYLSFKFNGEQRTDRSHAYTRYADFERWTTSFDRMAVAAYRQLAVGVGEDAREMTVAGVSATLFDFFDARPALGRFFTAEEDRTPVGAPVAVISHAFWKSRYAGDPNVIGQRLHVGSGVLTVIGVAPDGFIGMTEDDAPAVFLPVTHMAGSRNQSYFRTYQWDWLNMFARRKEGIEERSAEADLTNAYLRSWEEERVQDGIPEAGIAEPSAILGPVAVARGPVASDDSRIVQWVSGVAFIVLLIACANVANLLLARALRRRREVALRLALGVTRRRLAQQLLTESMVLAALGSLAGLLLAQWGGTALRSLFLRSEDARAVITDARTVLFAAALTVVVALITGVAPLVHAFRGDVASALKEGVREGSYRRSRTRVGLLVFQGALSVVLLVGAGLFVRSLQNVRELRLGYDVEPVLYVAGNLRGARLSEPERHALDARLLDAAAEVPGVRSATLTVSVPFWSNEGRSLHVPGRDSLHRLGRFLLQAGSPSYFETLGTRIIRGRGFTDQDRAGSQRVVVVSEGMARAVWPDTDPIGQLIRVGDADTPFSTVIGVAENMRARLLQDEREFWYYIPMAQYGPSFPELFVRVDGRAEDFADAVRRRLQQEMPGSGYVVARPLRSLVGATQRSWEFGATMFVAFGALALVLAAIGLYSVIAYSVQQRTHELGVRIALGAGVGDVLRMIVSQGVAFAVSGIVIGALLSLWGGRWLEPLLFSQSAKDPLIFGGVALLVLTVAVVATLRPALRAMSVDPTVALRAD